MPLTHPQPHWTVTKAKEAGVEIVGDIELFARTVNAAPEHKRPKVIVITGTNGKSTTTALIGHVCRQAGKDARIGGNIGIGVLGLDDMHGGAVYVLEVSSYQLDLTSSLKPDVAVLLNISPDHLDRHGGMEGYVAAKRRVLLNQGKGDTRRDRRGRPLVPADLHRDHRRQPPHHRADLLGPRHRPGRLRPAGRALRRLHRAGGRGLRPAARPVPARTPQLAERGGRLRRLPRAGHPARRRGRRPAQLPWPGPSHGEGSERSAASAFINDSKATNADAARQAMSSYPRFYWIAGGVPKAGGIDSLTDLYPRIAKAFLIGRRPRTSPAALDGSAPYDISGDLATATAAAFAEG